MFYNMKFSDNYINKIFFLCVIIFLITNLNDLKMKKIWLLLAVTVSFVSACDKEEFSDFQMVISAEKCICGPPFEPYIGEIEGRMIRLIGFDDFTDEWHWFCSGLPYIVKGFNYKEGYEYELLIRKTKIKTDPKIIDQPSAFLTLIEVISMTPVNVADE